MDRQPGQTLALANAYAALTELNHFSARETTYVAHYDEREKPAKRKRLKGQKRRQQGDRCQNCGLDLPQRGAVLDRLNAMKGYTLENTRLLCPRCDLELQTSRGYK